MLAMPGTSPPSRPGRFVERLTSRLFLALAPRLKNSPQPDPPRLLEPFEHLGVERVGRGGALSATWYPASGKPRGAVLLLHPWVEGGRTSFYRRGRIQALRAAGYHALTCDLSGFGSSPPAALYFDRDVEDALGELRRRAGGLPLHVWGVSSGGYWAHLVLSRLEGVCGAFFEDVSPHLLEWSRRTAPLGRPFYAFFRTIAPSAWRYLDLRRHAAHLKLHAAAYVSGDLDQGVLPEETRELARLAGAECLVVAGADHLAALRVAGRQVRAFALETFRRAEAAAAQAAQPRRVSRAVLEASVAG